MKHTALGKEYPHYEAIADEFGLATSTVHRWSIAGKLDEKLALVRDGKYVRRKVRPDFPVIVNNDKLFNSIGDAAKHYKIQRHVLQDVISRGIFQIAIIQGEKP